MKIYSKLLAISAIAFRLFCLNSYADPIVWENISHFFNFDTIEAEKRTDLETNIQLLIKEQLKLTSGRNLWKAFQFWKEQHPKLGFQFCFELTDSLGASVVLDEYETSTKTFIFKIAINKVFAEKYFTNLSDEFDHEADGLQKLLSENMLYRPCLIKLVDPNDSSHWEYHLREQELPFFITLAHEFLHALNQLERIADIAFCEFIDCFEKEKTGKLLDSFHVLDVLDKKVAMQDFLVKKLNIQKGSSIFNKDCKGIWGNDHFLDEMTVILGSQRKIKLNEKVFIGETTFLREYYNDKKIISWSHLSARDIEFWTKMNVVLEKEYVSSVLKDNWFGSNESNVQSFCVDRKNQGIYKEHFIDYRSTDIWDAKLNSLKLPAKIVTIPNVNIPNNVRVFLFDKVVSGNSILLLPKVEKKTVNTWGNYKIVDVPRGENNVFSAIATSFVGNFPEDPKVEELKVFKENVFYETLREEQKKKIEDWNEKFAKASINEVSNCGNENKKTLRVFVTFLKELNYPILIIIRGSNGQFQYQLFDRGDNCSKKYCIDDNKVANILNDYPDTIKLYHCDNHFRAIILKKKTISKK